MFGKVCAWGNVFVNLPTIGLYIRFTSELVTDVVTINRYYIYMEQKLNYRNYFKNEMKWNKNKNFKVSPTKG